MDEIPENLKQAMESYALQHLNMEENDQIKDLEEIRDELLRQVNDVDLQIEKLANGYLRKIEELEDYIKSQVLEIGSSVEYAGVKVSHRVGHERITWNNKKMSSILLSNPNLAPIFAPARKVTNVNPSVNVIYVGLPEEKESVAYSREDYERSRTEVETLEE